MEMVNRAEELNHILSGINDDGSVDRKGLEAGLESEQREAVVKKKACHQMEKENRRLKKRLKEKSKLNKGEAKRNDRMTQDLTDKESLLHRVDAENVDAI